MQLVNVSLLILSPLLLLGLKRWLCEYVMLREQLV